MRFLSLLLLTFAALLGISFAVLNAEPVMVNYYIGTQKLPLSILIIGVLILGVIIGWFMTLPTILKLKMQLRSRD